jgi:hypothetical protein
LFELTRLDHENILFVRILPAISLAARSSQLAAFLK